MTYDFLESEQALAEFLDLFEQGTLPKAIWTHAAHLAVGTWYLVTFPEEITAIDRVRTGIQHYNECVGTANTEDSGYHETLTRVWLILVGAVRRNGTAGDSSSVLAAPGLARDAPLRYYSRDRLFSAAARAMFVPPDLAELP